MTVAQGHRAPRIGPRGEPLPPRAKVLHLVANNLPFDHFRPLVELADPDKFEVTVASLDAAGPLQEGMRRLGAPTFAVGAATRAQYPRALAALARRIARERYGVVHTHLLDACLVGLPAARLARVPATVLTAHHSHEIALHRRLGLFVADRIAAGPCADAIVAPSRWMRDRLVAVHRLPPGKIRVVPHGFDFSRLDPDRVDGTRFRAEHNLRERVVVGAVSRHFWIKNLDSLVEAFGRLAPQREDLSLVIVGGGDPAGIRELVRARGLGERTLLLDDRRDLAEAMAAFDVFVHPSLAESFGMVVVEAMALRRPVVATAVGIAPDVIEDGSTAVLAAGPDPGSLEAALRRMLSLRELWPEIGKRARERVSGFTLEAWVRAYEALYDSLLRSSPRWRRPSA